MPRLKITTGKQTGRAIDLSKATIVGRGETAQFQISDNAASREHCKVFEQAGAWVVADLNSRNGIKVNDVQTTRKNLAHGDRIVIGETTIVFETSSAPAAKSAAAPAARPSGGGAAKPSPAAAAAQAKKEAAFAAARASSGRGGATATARASTTDGGVKVSDHVLQFHKVDPKKATVLDVDLSQSPGMSRLILTVGCLALLGGVVWLVVKLMA
jgi:predicted component of type VI protein secretion system